MLKFSSKKMMDKSVVYTSSTTPPNHPWDVFMSLSDLNVSRHTKLEWVLGIAPRYLDLQSNALLTLPYPHRIKQDTFCFVSSEGFCCWKYPKTGKGTRIRTENERFKISCVRHLHHSPTDLATRSGNDPDHPVRQTGMRP